MMNAKHTPGPLKVVMSSTCSATWPAIVQSCIDPETNEVWDREIGKAETSHLETAEARASEEMPATYDEAPHRFRLDEGGEEAIANATLWAAAPDLLEALNAVVGAYQCGADLNIVMDQVKSVIAKATGEPQ